MALTFTPSPVVVPEQSEIIALMERVNEIIEGNDFATLGKMDELLKASEAATKWQEIAKQDQVELVMEIQKLVWDAIRMPVNLIFAKNTEIVSQEISEINPRKKRISDALMDALSKLETIVSARSYYGDPHGANDKGLAHLDLLNEVAQIILPDLERVALLDRTQALADNGAENLFELDRIALFDAISKVFDSQASKQGQAV